MRLRSSAYLKGNLSVPKQQQYRPISLSEAWYSGRPQVVEGVWKTTASVSRYGTVSYSTDRAVQRTTA